MSIASDMAEEERLLLGELVQMSMALSRRLHERAMANEDPDKDAGLTLACQRAGRAVRQTLAVRARLQRERDQAAAEAERRSAETRREAVKARRSYVGGVGSRLIWTEAERDDVSALLVDLKRWIDEEAFFEEDFLAAPVETLVERLREDLGLVAAELDEEEEAEADPPDPSPLAGSEASRPSGCPSRQRFGETARPDGGLPEEGRMRGLSDPATDAQPFSPLSG